MEKKTKDLKKPGRKEETFRSPDSKNLTIPKKTWKTYFPKVLTGIFVLLLVGFIARVMIWEHNYYNNKEGSEREAPLTVQPPNQTELDETEVDDKYSYVVPADYPRFLTVDKLGIKDARIIAMGVTAENAMDVPNNIFDVGWYTGSDKPGTGGTMVIDGHNGGPNIHGVFKDLPSLTSGDIIKVERGDGKIFKYKVVENKTILLSEANKYMPTAMSSPYNGVESVTLISCTGEWSQVQYTYLSRQFTRAILINE